MGKGGQGIEDQVALMPNTTVYFRVLTLSGVEDESIRRLGLNGLSHVTESNRFRLHVPLIVSYLRVTLLVHDGKGWMSAHFGASRVHYDLWFYPRTDYGGQGA